MVPLDGSGFAEAALRFAAPIARAAGIVMRLVHVREDSDGVASQIEELCRRMRDEHGLQAEPVFLEDDDGVASRLSEWLRHETRPLVIMTTRGRSGIRKLVLGSVASELLRLAPAPLILASPRAARRAGATPWSLERILVPLDGSAVAAEILDPAAALGAVSGASYVLLRVIEPAGDDAGAFGLGAAEETRARDSARHDLAGAAELLRGARGVSVESRVVGHPAPGRAIIEVAEETRASCVAMTTHGRSGLSKLLMGSKAEAVLGGSGVPVLLARPQAASSSSRST